MFYYVSNIKRRNTMNKYILINNQGCIFDTGYFSSKTKAKKWAAGRSGKYRLFVWEDEVGQVFRSASLVG